jgi:tight adherence protein B
MSMLYIILLSVVIVAGVAMIALMIKAQSDHEKQKQLSIISGRGTTRNDVNDKDVKGKRLAELARKLKDNREDEQKKSEHKKNTIRDMLIYAGLNVPTYYFWLWSAAAGGVFILGALISGANPLVMMTMGVIGFFGAPRLVLKIMAGKRQKKFLEEFADGLESMVRLLKAGMPVGEAIAMIAREFHGPLGEEMGKVYENQRIGVSLAEAIQDCARRMPLPEVQMFATGIVIQQQTGSSLSDVLLNLSSLIRARYRLKRKVHALSAEAKASAAIIGALPIVVATGLYFLNPEYISLLFTNPTGKMWLTGAVIWMSMGILVMRQMINFKV